MKIPKAVKLFPLNPNEKAVFSVVPDKQVKKFLDFMGTEVVVKKSKESDRTNELLAGGAAVGWRIGRILAKLRPDTPVEHAIIKSDCSQQSWAFGDFAVRQVSCAEDLLSELAQGKPSLCVINHDNLQIRSAIEEFHDFLENTSPGKRPVFDKKVSLGALDLLPQLVELSPKTQFIITCHQRGSGISKTDRARYAKFDAVINVMGWIDTAANTKWLLKLIRQHYSHALK